MLCEITAFLWNFRFQAGYFLDSAELAFWSFPYKKRGLRTHPSRKKSYFDIVYEPAAYGGDAFPTSAIEDSLLRRKCIPQKSTPSRVL